MGAARPWQPLAGAVVGALGLACLLRRPASSAGGALRLEAAAPLRFGARGAYETTAGVGYPWLDGEVLVEPFRETTLYAVNHNGEAVTWMVNGAHAVGEETSRTFETVGEHSVWLETRTRAYASRVVCRYVRREIRSLSDDDREAFFRAAGVLYATPDAEGARAYGRAYKSAAYFIATHNELSGDRTCDHFHDGLGFLPQHAAFTLRFERALQSVDPKVSVPYWDYTIEAYDVAVAGDMAAWRRSPVFRDDWFGDAQPEGHVVNAGRWAYTAVARASSADTANAYGLIRAPWNVNKVPYLTRANTTFGFSLSDVPSCADHYAVMQTTAWSDFGVDVQYNAHGTVHAMIGGVTGADLQATLLGLGMRAIPAENIALEAFATQKNLWRAGQLDCPTGCSSDAPVNDCKCACTKLQTWLDEDRAAGILLSVSPIFADALYLTNRRGADVSEAILSALCNVGDDLAPSIGDSLESASPLDISFYPTHPTVDRLYHWRRINGFSDETWTDDMARSVSFEDVGYCWGHNLNDTLVWGDDLFADGAAGPYTNAMLWAAFDPTDGNSPTPYVYDTFEWPHCAAQGYPLTLIGNATNAEASGKAMVDDAVEYVAR